MTLPQKHKDYLSSIYFNPSHPGSYGSPASLYRVVKREGKFQISLNAIGKWLQGIDSYTLHRQPRRKFKRNKVYVPRMDYQWDADLMDMTKISTYNDGYSYVLLVIDILSRYVWTVPLKSKRGEEVVKAFQSIIGQPRELTKVRTDKGTEFTNHKVQSYFRSVNVEHFVTQNEEIKANYAERAIKSIKGKVYKYFTENQTRRYIDVLESFTESYNSSFHRSIGMSPKDVNKENELEIHNKLYYPDISISTLPRKRFKYHVGDFVRLVHSKKPFTREYDERWTGELFKIVDRKFRDGIPIYRIEDYSGDDILGTFYEPELQKVIEPEIYKIDKILKTRKRKGQPKEFLVRWLRWPAKYDLWITEKDMK